MVGLAQQKKQGKQKGFGGVLSFLLNPTEHEGNFNEALNDFIQGLGIDQQWLEEWLGPLGFILDFFKEDPAKTQQGQDVSQKLGTILDTNGFGTGISGNDGLINILRKEINTPNGQLNLDAQDTESFLREVEEIDLSEAQYGQQGINGKIDNGPLAATLTRLFTKYDSAKLVSNAPGADGQTVRTETNAHIQPEQQAQDKRPAAPKPVTVALQDRPEQLNETEHQGVPLSTGIQFMNPEAIQLYSLDGELLNDSGEASLYDVSRRLGTSADSLQAFPVMDDNDQTIGYYIENPNQDGQGVIIAAGSVRFLKDNPQDPSATGAAELMHNLETNMRELETMDLTSMTVAPLQNQPVMQTTEFKT